MLMLSFIQWWYGPGWRKTALNTLTHIKNTYIEFSVPILIPTLFSPWRRIISSGQGSMGMRLRAVLDNFISRFVGAIVRLLTLLVAFLMMGATLLIGFLLTLLWPLLPFTGPALILWSLFR